MKTITRPKVHDVPTLYKATFDRDFTAEYQGLRRLREIVQRDFTGRLLAEQKRRQPRARVRFKDLPEDVLIRIRDEMKQSPVYKEIERLTKAVGDEQDRREKLLKKLAPWVATKPDPMVFYRLKTSTSLSYATQGYGAMKYAKGSLEPLRDMLVALGFTVYISRVGYHRGTGMFAIDHADYVLWANCPPWMFDAAHRCLSLDDSVASLKRRCINPLVYHPMGLPEWARL